MKRIAVVTDSTAYIPDTALEGLHVSVIPVWLLWDEDRFRDGVDIDPPTFYRRLEASETLPTSSQPSAGEFVAFYQQVAAEADAIVSVLVSSKLSGTIASAQAARAQLPELDIRIVDSQSSSVGLGLAVLAAASAVAAGASPDEAVAAAEEMRDKVHLLFVVDTLEYLHRGGRISGAKRMLGTALQIKPILHFDEGQIASLTQARTKRKAIQLILDLAEERLGGREMAEAVVVDINSPESGDAVAGLVVERFAPPLSHRSGVSPVVGMHVGPGAIGLAFYAEQ
ncbi:MAG: DegV family protein [Anaerolineae bacterium]|nr:MAG: DegV family protein [Anaerolineae bacterium]